MRFWGLVALGVAAACAAALAARAVLAVPAGGAPGSRTAARILVPGDVRSERAAEQQLAAATRPDAGLRKRAQLEDGLRHLAYGRGRVSVRSRAATLLGLLVLDDARVDPTSAPGLLATARDAFRRAVRLDPGNGPAAYDLELLLTLRQRSGQSKKQGNRAAHRQGRAGAQPPGSGF